MRHMWILLLALLVLPLCAYGQRVIDENSIYNVREGMVFDTLTAERCALRNRLWLSDAATKAAQAQFGQVFGAAVKGYTATTRATYRQAQAQGVQGAIGMLAEVAKLDNATANAFLKQLEADHADDFTYVYRIDRVDNKTFLVYFLNSSAHASLTFQITYTNEDKYTSTYQVSMVATQPFSIDVDEIDELKYARITMGRMRLN